MRICRHTYNAMLGPLFPQSQSYYRCQQPPLRFRLLLQAGCIVGCMMCPAWLTWRLSCLPWCACVTSSTGIIKVANPSCSALTSVFSTAHFLLMNSSILTWLSFFTFTLEPVNRWPECC